MSSLLPLLAILSAAPSLVLQHGHADGMTAAAWAPDERVVATGGKDGDVLLWSPGDGALLARLKAEEAGPADPRKRRSGQEREVSRLLFSKGGRLLAAVTTRDGAPDTAIWEVATRKLLARVEGMPAGWLADDESLLFGEGEEEAWLWNHRTGAREVLPTKFVQELSRLALSPDARFAVGHVSHTWMTNDPRAIVWDLQQRRVALEHRSTGKAIVGAAFSQKAPALAVVDDRGQVVVYDTATLRERSRFAVGFEPEKPELWLTPDGDTLLLHRGGDGAPLEARDARTGALRAAVKNVALLGLTAEGEALVNDAGAWARVGEVHATLRWDPRTGRKVELGKQLAEPLALSPSGRRFVANRFWDRAGERYVASSEVPGPTPQVAEFPGGRLLSTFGIARAAPQVQSLSVSPDGRNLLLSVGPGEGIAFGFDSQEKNRLLSWEVESGRFVVRAEADELLVLRGFTRDGRHALLDGTPSLLIDLAGDRPAREVPGALGLAFREGREQVIALVSTPPESSRLALKDLETGALVRNLEPVPAEHPSFGDWSRIVHVELRELVASPDGAFLAASAQVEGENEDEWAKAPWGAVFVWDLGTGKFLRALDPGGAYAGSLTFSPDSRWLGVVRRPSSVRLYRTGTWEEVKRLEGHRDPVEALAFSADGRRLLSGGGGDQGDHSARLWDVERGAGLRVLRDPVDALSGVGFLHQGRIAVAASRDGTVSFWEAESGKPLGRLLMIDATTWLGVTPEGRYETNTSAEIDHVRWVLPEEPFRALPVELFMRDYYEARLLPRVLAGEVLPPLRELGKVNRVQPGVRIVRVKPTPKQAGSVDVTVEVSAPAALKSGVFDLRLFRNGQLVGAAPEGGGEVALGSKRTAQVTFRGVRLPAAQRAPKVELSAYAFNADRIKSGTARQLYAQPARRGPASRRTAYVITVGVNAYENPAWNLLFAVNDAQRLSETLTGQLRRAGTFEEVVPIRLLSPPPESAPAALPATKANLRAVLEQLAGKKPAAPLPALEGLRRAGPDDLVLLSFSGHGHAEPGGVFYLLPQDLGPGPGREATPALLARSISSEELAAWLRPVDAGELTLIVDACHSAASVDAGGFKPGPMGSRGLGQLAFDKGMRVLAASQGDDVALESAKVRQGLLSFALVNDGLESGLADNRPGDRRITLAEWLEYGVDRVPVLFDELIRGGGKKTGSRGVVRLNAGGVAGAPAKKRRPQTPALFDFARRRADPSIAVTSPRQ